MNGREMEFNISYPKRFFSLNGEYLWEEDSLKIQATANPNLYTAANSLTGVALWDYFASNNTHLLTLILAHPSLSQVSYSDTFLALFRKLRKNNM